MRRPLALFGFTSFACGLLCLVGKEFAVCAGLILSASGIFLFLFRHKRYQHNRIYQSILGCLLACFCAVCLLALTYVSWIKPLALHDNSVQNLTMTVERKAQQYDTVTYYIVSTKGLYENPNRSVRLRLAVKTPHNYNVGDLLQGPVELQTLSFEEKPNLMAEGIYLTAKESKDSPLQLAGTRLTVYSYAELTADKMQQFVMEGLPGETGGLVLGICLGRTECLSDATIDAFSRAGLSHLVAVSGLHTGIVSGLIVGLFVFLQVKKRYLKLLALGFVWGFVFMAGAPYSACRAGVMFTIFAFTTLFHRKADLLNTLGGAVLFLFITDPFGVADIGFVASVSSCLGIILWAQPVGTYLGNLLPKRCRSWRGIGFVNNVFGVTIAATAGILPCSLLCFYQVSLIAPLANLLAGLCATAVLILGLGSGLLALLPGWSGISGLVLSAGGLVARLLLGIARFLGRFSFSSAPFSSVWCLLATALILLVCLILPVAKPIVGSVVYKSILLLLVILLIVSTFLPAVHPTQYRMLTVGDDYSGSLLIFSQNKAMVVGCSRPYQIHRMLGWAGISQVDCLILPDTIAYGDDLKTLLTLVSVKEICLTADMVKQGLLAGLESSLPPVSHKTNLTFGDMRLQIHSDFTEFTWNIYGEEIVYACQPKAELSENMILHPNATDQQGFWVKTDTVNEMSHKEIILVFTPNGNHAYYPRFLFG